MLKVFLKKMIFQKLASYKPGWLILLAFFIPVTSYAQPEERIPAPLVNELVALIPANFPPYASLNENNKAEGFIIDIFSIIAERAGISFNYQPEQQRADVVQQLSRGVGDILLNIGAQEDVAQWMDFTPGIVTIPLSVFVREDTSQLRTINDLDKHKLAILAVHNRLRPELPDDFPANLEIEEFDAVEVAFYAMMSGKVDALIAPEPLIWNVAINLQLSDKVRVLPPSLNEFVVSIGVRRQNPQLLQQLEVARQSLMGTDQFNEIYDKWFHHDLPFWNTKTVFWTMSAIMVLTLLITQWFRSRELEAVNATLQQQIDDATIQLSENNAYLKDLTVTDTLTGINNRRAFENSLSELILRSRRYNEVFSMLIFDIDDFKKLNDQYGHAMGDSVLVELVDRVTEVVRDVDTLCRWGGEEFTILMPQTSQMGAIKMAERCRSAIADEAFDEVGQVTISLGVTSYMPNDTERKLFKRADDALYEAKSQGKNCVVWNDELSV